MEWAVDELILLVLGLPGRFTRWCSAAAIQLAERSGETASFAWPPLDAMLTGQQPASVLEELGARLIATDAAHLVVSVHQPDDKLCKMLAATSVPFVLALDEPGTVVADIVGETGAAASQVVRALANGYPLLMRYDGLAAAFPLTADPADPAASVAAIAAHFGLALGAGEAAAIARRLGRPGNPPVASLPDAALRLLDGALSPYHRYFQTGSLAGALGEIVWRRDLFLRADGGSLSEAIEATGGARYLVYGPYIRLPPGEWTARIVLGFLPETAGGSFAVDAVADGQQVAKVAVDPERAGAYAADIDFAIVAAGGSVLEIRVMVAGDDVRGRLAFGHAVLQRRSPGDQDPFDSTQDFASVLAL